MKRVMGIAATCMILSGHALAAEGADGSKQLHLQMKKSAAEMQKMKMTGDVDHDFVAAMRKHHEDGIAMAKIALASGKDATAREFAQKIIDDQTQDLQKFELWLSQHKAHTPSRARHQGHGTSSGGQEHK